MRRRRYVRRKVLLILLILLILLRQRRPSYIRKRSSFSHTRRFRRGKRNISIHLTYPRSIPLQWPYPIAYPFQNMQIPTNSSQYNASLNVPTEFRSDPVVNPNSIQNTNSSSSNSLLSNTIPITTSSIATSTAISNESYDVVKPFVIEKECCGNILISEPQKDVQIWEIDVLSRNTVVQLSLFSSPGSTDDLKVELLGMEKRLLHVSPGNTVNFIGQGIQCIRVSAQGDNQTYIEGKYVVSTTLHMEGNPIPFPVQEKKENLSDG